MLCLSKSRAWTPRHFQQYFSFSSGFSHYWFVRITSCHKLHICTLTFESAFVLGKRNQYQYNRILCETKWCCIISKQTILDFISKYKIYTYKTHLFNMISTSHLWLLYTRSYNHALHYHVTKFRSILKHFLIFKGILEIPVRLPVLFILCVRIDLRVVYHCERESHVFEIHFLYTCNNNWDLYTECENTAQEI